MLISDYFEDNSHLVWNKLSIEQQFKRIRSELFTGSRSEKECKERLRQSGILVFECLFKVIPAARPLPV